MSIDSSVADGAGLDLVSNVHFQSLLLKRLSVATLAPPRP